MTVGEQLVAPTVSEGYEWAIPADDTAFRVLASIDGTPLTGTWNPVSMYLLKDNPLGERRRHADLPWLNDNVMILRDSAIEAVGAILKPFGEILPLECEDARLAAFNACNVVDALDEARSEIIRFPSGRILDVKYYVLRRRDITSDVFRLRQFPKGAIFFSARVVEQIQRTGFSSGTEFRLIRGQHV